MESLPVAASQGHSMKSHPGLKRRLAHAALLVALGVGGIAQAQMRSADADAGGVDAPAAPQPVPVVVEAVFLFQRVELGLAKRALTLSVDFTPAAWHVGSPDGPVATDAQLKSVLGDLQRIVVVGHCADGILTAPKRPCAFILGTPDFAGIVNVQMEGEVFGWVATARASKAAAGNEASPAMDYFGLLSPLRYANPSGAGAMVALRYHDAGTTQLPRGFDRSAATLIAHNDRLVSFAIQTRAGHEVLMHRIAKSAPLPNEPARTAREVVLK